MSRCRDFEERLAAAWPDGVTGEHRVLIAVSGGPDSVALLRALFRLNARGGQRLAVAHFNHGWRGPESEADEQFVVDLTNSLQLVCHVERAKADTASSPDGVEAAARNARYTFLAATAERLGARYVVTGHTADDQAETILHHIVRGTGLGGLSGMERVRLLTPAVSLVRPMLELRRKDVTEYLALLGQASREDASNADRNLTRNRIRHELLPLISREYSPGIVESLLRLGSLAGDAQKVLIPLAEQLLEKSVLHREANRLTLNCQPLAGTPIHLLREMLVLVWRQQEWPRQSMGREKWKLLAAMVNDQANSNAIAMFPGGIRAEASGEQLVLTKT